MANRLSISIPSDTDVEESDGSTARDLFRDAKGGGARSTERRTSTATGKGRQPQARVRRTKTAATTNGVGGLEGYNSLHPTDQRVFNHLHELLSTQKSKEGIVVASIPDIHEACGISLRRVQISTDRLCAAKLIEKAGYDLGNSDRSKRGTKFKILYRPKK